MKKRYRVKSKRSLKENVQNILPLMFDDFMSYKEQVVNHPRLKTLMHRMRITGKPMRYVMEIMQPAFGEGFKKCLEEIKNTIELMGEIHDCDVNVPELVSFLSEMRQFNRKVRNKAVRFPTGGVIKLINQLRSNRKKMFGELCVTLNKWEKKDFKANLLASMNINSNISNIIEIRRTRPGSAVIKY